MPVDYRSGKPANAQDPANWLDMASATALVTAEWGMGFVLTESAHVGVIDIDGCRNPQTGEISPLAQAMIATLAGAYVEISISGRGIHIWFSYRGEMPAHASRAAGIGEFYHKDRYIAIGAPYEAPGFTNGGLSADFTAMLPTIVSTFFPPDGASGVDAGWSEGPCAEWYGPSDDGEILRRAMNSKSVASAFGSRASFADLWLADEKVLAASYPDPLRAYDASAADAALAQHLAFWTGSDCERIRRMMQQSGLARDKWEREDYLPRTILGAVSRQSEWLQDERPAVPAPPVANGVVAHAPIAREGDGFCNPEQQQTHFAGCVYVTGQNRALVPDGTMMKPEAFRVRYGGMTFPLDATNSKTTKDAWEAWTQSQIYRCPQVDGICFKPNLPPREIVTINGQTFINTYLPVNVARKVGDPAPFLEHLAKVLPDERDRTILLSYMAACVQHQGIKFQWAPLLQGVEGNGKTLFARCVEQAVGTRYTHWPKASKISKDFNAWMVGKVFYAVEDIYVPDSKREILEDLKPMITGGSIEIEAKGVDQISLDICGNFMFNSNHPDAIRKTENDRRFCVLFAAQQKASDLEKSGMDGDYFPNLYKWLNADGYAIVSDFLITWPISDALNPAVDCQRAPVTTSTHEAIAASIGGVEQEILEAVAQGLPGFCSPWISSVYLERLLEHLGAYARRISPYKRKQILEQLGYVHHPALDGGRTNNVVLPDNTKPRLYVLANSLAAQITNGAEVAKSYETTNTSTRAAFPFAQAR